MANKRFFTKAQNRRAAVVTIGLNLVVRSEKNALLHPDPLLLEARVKKGEVKNLHQQLFDKKMHGNVYRNLEDHPLSKDLNVAFCRSFELNLRTKCFIFVCQEIVIFPLVCLRVP